MKYNENFKKLLNTKNLLNNSEEYIIDDYEYVGLGNPDSKILFVGKEAGEKMEYTNDFDNIKENLKALQGSAFHWKTSNPDYTVNPEKLKDISQTWNKYQRLYEYIFKQDVKSDYPTFLKKVFTTEISNLPHKTTDEAKRNPFFKDELKKRKNTFFRTEFIQSFPVTVLAFKDPVYIRNDDETREIDDIFKVRYLDKSKEYSVGNQFYIHYNEDKTKLVIHTRNLSANVNTDLLKDMGELIRNHLEKHSNIV